MFLFPRESSINLFLFVSLGTNRFHFNHSRASNWLRGVVCLCANRYWFCWLYTLNRDNWREKKTPKYYKRCRIHVNLTKFVVFWTTFSENVKTLAINLYLCSAPTSWKSCHPFFCLCAWFWNVVSNSICSRTLSNTHHRIHFSLSAYAHANAVCSCFFCWTIYHTFHMESREYIFIFIIIQLSISLLYKLIPKRT